MGRVKAFLHRFLDCCAHHLKYVFHIPEYTDAFFRQIKSFLRFRLAFVFGLQTYYLIGFSKIYQSKGLKPKNKGHLKS